MNVKAQWDASRRPQPAQARGGSPTAALGALGAELEKLSMGAADARELIEQVGALRQELANVVPALQAHAAGMGGQAEMPATLSRLAAELSDLRAMVGEISGKVDALAQIAARPVVKEMKVHRGQDGEMTGATVTEQKE